MTLQIISAEEIIQFHDRLLRVTPGVAGMPDPGRAEAIMYRVLNKIEYEGVTDVWRLAAMHLLAISRGHIFNDGNKRTALFTLYQCIPRREGEAERSPPLQCDR